MEGFGQLKRGTGAGDDGALDDGSQLPDVSGPVLGDQAFSKNRAKANSRHQMSFSGPISSAPLLPDHARLHAQKDGEGDETSARMQAQRYSIDGHGRHAHPNAPS